MVLKSDLKSIIPRRKQGKNYPQQNNKDIPEWPHEFPISAIVWNAEN